MSGQSYVQNRNANAGRVTSHESLAPSDSASNIDPFEPEASPFSSPFDSPEDANADADAYADADVDAPYESASDAESDEPLTMKTVKRRSYPPPRGFNYETEGTKQRAVASESGKPLTAFLVEDASLLDDRRLRPLITEILRIIDDPVVRSPLLYRRKDWEASPLAISPIDTSEEQSELRFIDDTCPLIPLWRKTPDNNNFTIIEHIYNPRGTNRIIDDYILKISTRLVEHRPGGAKERQMGPVVYAFRVMASERNDFPRSFDILDFEGFIHSPNGAPSWDQLIAEIKKRLEQLRTKIPGSPPRVAPTVVKAKEGRWKGKLKSMFRKA